MPSATINKTYSLPGYSSRQASVVRSADHANVWGGSDAPITLNDAKAVTDWVKTDGDTAGCNLASGHGQTDGVFDVYWSSGGVDYVHYGATGTIVTNALSLDGGSGDDFPASATTGIVVCKQKEVATYIDGDAVSMFWAALIFGNVSATGRGHVDFQESAGTHVGEIDISGILNGTAIVDYDITGGVSNPLTGNLIAKSQISHNDTSYTPTFELVALDDSTA